MNLLENIRLAWEGLRANKMRALLTMLGIIIGIGSVIAILTVGNGMSGSITSSMSSLGASNITIYLQEKDVGGNDFRGMFASISPDADSLITDEMIERLQRRYASEVAGVSLTESVGSGKAQDGRLYANVSVSGVNGSYAEVNNLELLQGRSITQRDLVGLRNAAMVSDKLVNNMFRGDMQAALGQELKVQVGDEIYVFSIVGVYEYTQSSMGFSTASEKDISTALYIPITTAKKINGSDAGYAAITVMAAGTVDSVEFATQLEDFFNRFYEKNEDFRCAAMSMESMVDQINTIMDSVSIALSVIAGISLLVGGIGVMNIMLVSVTERTREIGTRKALGATNGNIRVQFVVESTIVCLIGGVFGVILGSVLGYFGSSLLGSAVGPDLPSIALAVGFSMGIGVFFGYYPANKAAKLDPIEALRYE